MEEGIPDELWIFGYGSIIWKNAEVTCTKSVIGFIDNHKRRFWQGSPDHRGTKAQPGRVVSIYTPEDFSKLKVEKKDESEVSSSDDAWRVHGRAFLVTAEYREKVLDDLLVRERVGFQPIWLPVYRYPEGARGMQELVTARALTFKAPIENSDFKGFASHFDIAKHIASCKGMAGENREYAVNLHAALEEMDHVDAHVKGVVEQLYNMQQ